MYNNNIFNQTKNSIDLKSTILRLLPIGRREFSDWVTLNPTRNDNNLGSFRVNLTSGKWIDHATGDKGGDIISLVAYINGISQYEAAQYLSDNSTCSKKSNLSINPPKAAKPVKVNVSEYINKLWNEGLDAKNSVVETYLNNRGLLLEHIPEAIRYHPNLYHKPSNKHFPAMLSAVTKYGIDNLIALHRTYLKDDGAGKADISPNKMMLGKVKSGAVVITTADSSTLLIAEGIETALSVYRATGFSTWASLSAWGMVSLQVPPIDITQKIIIVADADVTGITSANKLATKLLDEGYKVSIAMPSQGTDFNNLLKEEK